MYVYVKEPGEILRLLEDFAECFPGLAGRVGSVELYAEKLARYAKVAVLKENGEEAGICCWYDNDREGRIGYIPLIGIRTEKQGKGYGKELLAFVCGECRSSGMEKVRLEVDAENGRAIAFYERNGFRRLGKARDVSFFYEKEVRQVSF